MSQPFVRIPNSTLTAAAAAAADDDDDDDDDVDVDDGGGVSPAAAVAAHIPQHIIFYYSIHLMVITHWAIYSIYMEWHKYELFSFYIFR